MRMLWIVTIAVVLFATVSHANRANAAHPRARALMAPLVNGDANCLRAVCPAASVVSPNR
jgi:hypothetical protein